jgi:hypothetical protein
MAEKIAIERHIALLFPMNGAHYTGIFSVLQQRS